MKLGSSSILLFVFFSSFGRALSCSILKLASYVITTAAFFTGVFDQLLLGNILSDYFSLEQESPTPKLKTIHYGTRNHRYFWVQK